MQCRHRGVVDLLSRSASCGTLQAKPSPSGEWAGCAMWCGVCVRVCVCVCVRCGVCVCVWCAVWYVVCVWCACGMWCVCVVCGVRVVCACGVWYVHTQYTTQLTDMQNDNTKSATNNKQFLKVNNESAVLPTHTRTCVDGDTYSIDVCAYACSGCHSFTHTRTHVDARTHTHTHTGSRSCVCAIRSRTCS